MSACIRKCNGGRKRLSLKERYVVLGKTFESVCLYVADPATFLGTVFSSENSLFIQLRKKMNILFVFLHTAPFNWKEKISFLPSSFSTFLPSPSVICITISLPPLLHLPPFPSFLSWRGSPRTHGVLVGSVLPRKTSDSCSVCICVCVCLCVCVVHEHSCCPLVVVSPHMLALTCWPAEDYELQALIKTGFVYPPACTRRQQKQCDPVRRWAHRPAVRKATANPGQPTGGRNLVKNAQTLKLICKEKL